MQEVSTWLSVYAISAIAYELSRLIVISHSDKKMPWYLSALCTILTIIGALAMFTIGIIHTRIDSILARRHIEQMKKLRVIAELQCYPDPNTEKRYDLDCRFYGSKEDFNICLWKLHEYEKLGL